MATTPQSVNGYEVYNDGGRLVGMAEELTLPSFDALTTELKGAGLAGSIDVPSVGHFGPMSVTLNWRQVTAESLALLGPETKQLEIRGALQVFDQNTAETSISALKVIVSGLIKTGDLGKLSIGETMDATSEIEVTYIKIAIDDENIVELDKYADIFITNGTDHLADKRAALGLS